MNNGFFTADQIQGMLDAMEARLRVMLTPATDPRDLVKVGEVLDFCLENTRHELGDRSWDSRQFCYRTFRIDFGDKLVKDCTALDLKRWVADHPEYVSNWTKSRVIGDIKRAFNVALEGRIIRENPFHFVKRPKGRPRKPMSDDHYRVVLRHARASFRRYVVFLAWTGCRTCEGNLARWEQVDWERGVIIQEDHKTVKKTGEPRTIALTMPALKLLLWIQRNEYPRQESPCASWLYLLLKDGPRRNAEISKLARREGFTYRMLHRARHRLKVKQFALPRRSEYKGIFTGRHPCIIVELSDPTMPAPPQGLEGIIFRGRKGNPWHRSSISSAMTRIRRRARRAGQTAPSCLYGLRHRFAARCIRQNINVRIVASLLGHKTMRMLEHYTASISADIDLLKTELAKVKLG